MVSFLFTGAIVITGLFINSACGYAFARLQLPGNRLVFTAIAALIIIPFEALALPLFLVVGVKWRLMNTLPGLFLPYLAKAFNIFFMRQYFLSLPRDLEEAARVEGASWLRVFFFVALPLAKPALATCAILDFITHWSEYLWPLIITNKVDFETVQVGLGHFYTLPPIQWGDIMAYSVMATIPMVIIFIFFQRYLVLSMFTTGLKE
jgi:multiple sugar transport system permease protein/fructooligosaccharide transport system permease protein